ncbi:unnamed protein product [Arctia plantaginis]|uniref:Epg5-like TPR domain-containing protein n=1 Tax=Arctia plantaginis TaxID=874455 RepID=A0A8S0ZTC6_ARCPL|nr:unnamed protein product [Arctia plantaginis]
MLGINIYNQEIVETQLQTSEKKPDTIYSPTDDKSNKVHEVSISNVDNSYELLNISNVSDVSSSNLEDSFVGLSKKLKAMAIASDVTERTPEKDFELLSPNAYLQEPPCLIEDVVPSAPCFEEIPQSINYQEETIECKPKVIAMPIEDVMRLYSGGEMEDVRSMIEREEEIVEAGPVSGPEHPLVDLLSTFRSSLMAVERERILLANGFSDEEKHRKSLWKIEKRHANLVEKCSCGANVVLKATYEHAEFAKEKLPVAKMRLESLLRDVQDSYCHHQHAALLAYYQIEEIISETIKSNKPVIREALSLVLGALRLSASALDALTCALQRWAAALATALVDHRDLRQLLFILHHLFKQSRSVRWASRVVKLRVDIESPPRILAVLELLLSKQRVDSAQECIEDADEVWEEVDKHGDGGAVSEGTLRERDLLSLLHALPIRDLVARILLFTHNDIKHARPHEWVDNSGGRSVLRACYGVRALLHVLQRATTTHASYARLRQTLRDIAARALHGLGYLHLTNCQYYATELKEKITSELEASFFEGLQMFESQDIHRLPATLLSEDAVKQYCLTYIEQLHDTSVLSCKERVRIVAQVSVDCAYDHELASMVLEFMLQTGLRRKAAQCKGACDVTARECVPRIIAAHAYLHSMALHKLADMNMVELLDVSTLNVHLWRPSTGEVRAVLDDWARRCPHLLQHLLLALDCTPYVGLPLDVQLSIGAWLCSYVRGGMVEGGAAPEWCWAALRRLRTHRSSWQLPLDAPPPEDEPTDLFSIAYALVSSSWGHCIPVICSEGVTGLCKLSAQRPRDAVHCLSGIMLVMAHSPESVALTPKFSEALSSVLSCAPGLLARALRRAASSGAELLLRLLLAQLEHPHVMAPGVLSAWLHALWRAGQGAGALALADSAACAGRLWPQLGAYCCVLLQEENANEHINDVVSNASTAPLLCECLLRECHTQHETLVHYGYARLLNALHQQRAAGHKIHVDNALQQVSANISSEELVIYRVATAALAAPMNHPSHLTLWRLLLHLYLQRAPDFMSAPPVGPLFFSGLIKSRTLGHIKKRLQKTINYHHTEAESLKNNKSIETNQAQPTKRVSETSPVLVDDNLLPVLTIADLAGESSSSSDSDDSNEERVSSREESPSKSCDSKKNVFNLISYHMAAEKILSDYLCWLEEGDKVRAMPHHADIARYIPEHALEEAWKRSVPRPVPSEDLDNFPLPTPKPLPESKAPDTPFHRAVDTILKIKDRSRKRHKKTEIKSPVEEVDYRDARTLVSLVDKHLKDIETLAQEWCDEVSRISALDVRLWELVATLRVARPIPVVRKQCANNCAPIAFAIPAREWCISVDTDRGIKENRNSARTRIRRLARARPNAARTAAALHTIARCTRTSEAGIRVVERAWRCAGAVRCGDCAPARTVLTALVTDLCERWICDNGATCSQLVSSWGKRSTTPLQQALCGALLCPRRLPPPDWPVVYMALLDAQLPSHTVFSYLSKFEMSRWSETADIARRRDVLDSLLRAVYRYGSAPAREHHMLIEILGVHTALVMTSQLLSTHVKDCARMSIENKLPHTHWTQVVRAVDAKAAEVPFDQLGHLLRELGVMFWEARTGVKGSGVLPHLSAYAPYVARLLLSLHRAFVAVATRLSYEPERVARYSWSALQESWGAWISPHPGSLPLLPSTVEDEQYTAMVRHFVDNVHQIMLDCPGTEVHLLQHIFEWCVQTYVTVQTVPCMTAMPGLNTLSVTQESRVQASALLVELAKLPWREHQWFYGKSLQIAVQMSSSSDRELTSWCCRAWSHTTAETLLRDVGDQLIPRLALLLYLFTGTLLPHAQQLLDDACKLPWHRLPELALDEVLERFYREHHNVAQPYHDLPQFRLILLACELAVPPGALSLQVSAASRCKRSVGVSQWVRAATAPPLLPHVTAHTACLLETITSLETHLHSSEGELEDLLCRAAVIMCIEPAASMALPVWVSWLDSVSPRLLLASASAAASVTAFEHFATLSDTVAKVVMLGKQSGVQWDELSRRWSQSPWRSASVLASRALLHAAYACIIAHEHAPAQVLATFQAFLTANIHFIENEPMVGVWICYVGRAATPGATQEVAGGAQELAGGARALLARWAEPERRSLLSRVMYAPTHQPTPRHRALCRYAQWLLNPDETSRRGFETAFTSALGSTSDLNTWLIAPQLNKLVTLAIRLYPKHDKYFQYELQHVQTL